MQVIIKLFSTLSVIGNYDEIEKKTKEVGFGQHLKSRSWLVSYQVVTVLCLDRGLYNANIVARIIPRCHTIMARS